MSKIGLKVTKISGGVQEILTINGGDWTRKVVDIRSDIKVLSGKALEEGADVLMLSFLPNGSLLTLFHTIPGRSGDLVSAWIFIPNNCVITADEELALLQRVRAELSKSQVNDWAELETMLTREFPQKESFSFFESPQGKPCAVRYFGAGTDYGVKELLGDNIFQSEYAEHKYIFLLDRSSDIVVADNLVKSYAGVPLRTWILVWPPQLPAGITAKLNGRDFTGPVPAYIGQDLQLSIERVGFVPHPCPIKASREPIVLSAQIQWSIAVDAQWFRVEDDEKNDITASCQIQLNGQRLGHAPVRLTEVEAMRRPLLVVSCAGFEEYRDGVQLVGVPRPITITLRRKRQGVVYFINGVECPNLKACPSMYKVKKEVMVQHRKCCYCEPSVMAVGAKWKAIAVACLLAMLLIGIFAGGLGYRFISKPETKATNDTVQSQQQNQQPGQASSKGKNEGKDNATQQTGKKFDCLDATMWNKADMEAVEELKGLFEDLKTLNLKNLQGKWREKIDGSQNPKWKNFLDELERLNEIYPNKLKNGPNPEINTGGYQNAQTGINPDKYIKKLETALKGNSGGGAGGGAGGGSAADANPDLMEQ